MKDLRLNRLSRVAIAVASSLLTLALSHATLAQAAQKVRVDIPAQDLSAALTQFGRETGTEIVFSPDAVREKKAIAVKGEFERGQALKILLEGSGLTYRITAQGAIVVEPSQANTQVAEASVMRLAQADQTDSTPSSTEGQKTDNSENKKSDFSSEESDNKLEEIIVTATKRAERLQDVPLSIATIGHQDIERRGLIGMQDYLRSIPSVNQIDQGPVNNAIVIRGVTTAPEGENLFTGGTTVATYFDETSITGAAGLLLAGVDVRPVDIERIEVLRGPQGTAFGNSSLGGALRIIPAKPKLDRFGANLAASFSSTDGHGSENWMGQGTFNVPLITDQLAVRAVVYRYDESGFYRNIAGIDPATLAQAEAYGLGDFVEGYVQDDIGQMVSKGGRLAALWKPNGQLSVSMNFLSQKIEQDGEPGATLGKFEQARLPVAPQARLRGKVGELTDTEIDLLNIVLNYDLGWAELTSVASWVDGDSANATTVAGLPFSPSLTGVTAFDSFTAEMRVASQLDGRFQFLAGLLYEDVDDGFYQTDDWPGSPETNPLPIFGLPASNPMGVFNIEQKLKQKAIFGEVSYDLTDKLTATVGGRYFDYDKDEFSLLDGGLLGVELGTAIPVNRQDGDSDSIFKVNLSYKPTESGLVYASWSEGFRLGRPVPGLPAGVCDVNPADGIIDGTNVSIDSTRQIDSDFVENYEIGGKFTLFNRRMVVDTAVYHINWEGLPISQLADSCNLSYTTNAGAADSDGVELQASVFVVDGLRIDFGGAYTKAELSTDAPNLGAEKGDRLPASPEWSANLAAQYEFDLAGRKAFVRADSFYTGGFYGDLLQTPRLRAGDYLKIDARAGIAMGQLTAEVFVRNITNEDAYTWRSPTYGGSSYVMRPRTVGIQIGYTFD